MIIVASVTRKKGGFDILLQGDVRTNVISSSPKLVDYSALSTLMNAQIQNPGTTLMKFLFLKLRR